MCNNFGRLLINATKQNLQGVRWREFSTTSCPHVMDCNILKKCRPFWTAPGRSTRLVLYYYFHSIMKFHYSSFWLISFYKIIIPLHHLHWGSGTYLFTTAMSSDWIYTNRWTFEWWPSWISRTSAWHVKSRRHVKWNWFSVYFLSCYIDLKFLYLSELPIRLSLRIYP